MAPRFPGRRRGRDGGPSDLGTGDEDVRLDDDDHAWWAQRDIDEVWVPRERARPVAAPEPTGDVLAEHFGTDWRTSFGVASDPVPPPPPADDAPPPIDTSDPYEVLEIEAQATWEEIVGAHRAMARRHHPDRLVGRSPAEVAAGEDRIRAINAAYAELRVRRGR